MRYVLFSVCFINELLRAQNLETKNEHKQPFAYYDRDQCAIGARFSFGFNFFFIQNGSCCSLFVIKIITIDCMKRVQYIAEARIKFNMCQQHCIDLQSLECNIVRT